MAKLFIGLALVLMLGTAGLGFLAKGNIDKLQSSLKGTKSELETKRIALTKAEDAKKKADEDLVAANSKLDEKIKEVEAKAKEADDAKKAEAEAKAMVETKTKEVADLTAKIATMPAANPNAPVGEDPRIAEMQLMLTKAQAELAEAKQVSESMAPRVKEAEDKLVEAQKKERQRQAGFTRPGVQGRILAVNSGWNFVVLNIGDRQGVMVNSPLIVVRSNQPVARLRITSVEPSTAIADIIPGTLVRGVTVQPGDTVIFEGRPAVSDSTTKSEAGAGAPPLPN